MKISTKGRYALRIMIALAQYDGADYVSAKEISKKEGITLKYVEQIISLLNKAGFLNSLRGNCGGYKLKKKPSQYSAGEILRAAEGSLAPVACLLDKPNKCPRSKSCTTLKFWQGLNNVVAKYVDGVTLADFLKGKNKI